METDASIGAQLFWMAALGLTIGFVAFYVFGERGISLIPSIIVGLAGSLVLGVTALIVGLSAAIAYSFIGSTGFLFVVNTFRQKEKRVFTDTDRTEENKT